MVVCKLIKIKCIMDLQENFYGKKSIKQGKVRNLNAKELKNQRITRRMKKIIGSNTPFSEGDGGEKCAICLSECGENSAILPCAHVFCVSCIANWWVCNSTCPYCRKQF